MTQSKFSLADIISLLIGVGFGFICFLGFNYYSFGDTYLSIIVASAITLLMVGTSMSAIRLKRTNRNFTVRRVWEIFFIFLFTGFTICFTYFPFSHYFVVINREAQIQSKLTKNLNQIDKLYSGYEAHYQEVREDYLDLLETAISLYDLGNGTEILEQGFVLEGNVFVPPKDIQKQRLLLKFKRELFPEDFNEKRKSDSIYVNASEKVIFSWKHKPIGIFDVIKDLEKVIVSTKTKLMDLSKSGGHKNGSHFKPNTYFDEVKTLFETTGKPTILSLSIGFIIWLLMLLSYFTSNRSTKTLARNLARNRKKVPENI